MRSVSQLECVKIHMDRGEYALAYEVAHDALDIDPYEPRMILLMARVMKLSNRPGLRDYAKKISKFLDEDARNQLAEIMDAGACVNREDGGSSGA